MVSCLRTHARVLQSTQVSIIMRAYSRHHQAITGFFFNIFVKTQQAENSQNFKTQAKFLPKLKFFAKTQNYRIFTT